MQTLQGLALHYSLSVTVPRVQQGRMHGSRVRRKVSVRTASLSDEHTLRNACSVSTGT